MSDAGTSMRYGGKACQCGEELLPFTLPDGKLGVHLMSSSESLEITTLKEEFAGLLESFRAGDGRIDQSGREDLLAYRATLGELIQMIDAATLG